MTETLTDLQAMEAGLKAKGWSEGDLHWWRRSAYAEAGLAMPQPGPSTRSAMAPIKQPETGAEWARRLQGVPLVAMRRDDDDDRKAAAAKLTKEALALGDDKNSEGETGADWAKRLTGNRRARFIGVEER